jgi:hypothetical protein
MISGRCARCGAPFVSNQPLVRFCSARCRRRERDARKDRRPKLKRRRQRELERRIADPYCRETLSAKLRRKQEQEAAAQERARQREQRRKEYEATEKLRRERVAAKQALIVQIGEREYIRRQAAAYFQRALAERGPEIRARKRELMRDPERRRKKRERDLCNRLKRTALFEALRERGWLLGNEIVDAP